MNPNAYVYERHLEIKEGSQDIGPPLGECLQHHNDFDDWINGNGPQILICHGDGTLQVRALIELIL